MPRWCTEHGLSTGVVEHHRVCGSVAEHPGSNELEQLRGRDRLELILEGGLLGRAHLYSTRDSVDRVVQSARSALGAVHTV